MLQFVHTFTEYTFFSVAFLFSNPLLKGRPTNLVLFPFLCPHATWGGGCGEPPCNVSLYLCDRNNTKRSPLTHE